MTRRMDIALLPSARVTASQREDPWLALDEALDGVLEVGDIDLALLFVHVRFARFLPMLVQRVQERLQPGALAGCTGVALIASGLDAPLISLLTLHLPGASVAAIRLGEWLRDAEDDPARWREALDLEAADLHGMILLVDPYRTDAQHLLSGLHHAYPHATIVGGVPAGSVQHRQTWIIAGEETAGEGAVAIAIGGAYTIEPIVSQGCSPIGDSWTITGASKQWVETIGGRPAMDLLLDALRTIPPGERDQAGRNLYAGLAANEYRDHFERGDFLIRGIAGVEQKSGAIALNALPRVGQTIQFQVRDAQTAIDDLAAMLAATRDHLGPAHAPVAAILCTSAERHDALESTPVHVTAALHACFPELPAVGIFCSGEIGPVGRRSRPFLHGFTETAALIVRR